MSYDKDGNPQNENHPVKLQHQGFAWMNFLQNIRNNGYCAVEVDAVYDVTTNAGKETKKDVSNFEAIQKEVKDAFEPEVPVELTYEEQRMLDLEKSNEELKKQLSELTAGMKAKSNQTKGGQKSDDGSGDDNADGQGGENQTKTEDIEVNGEQVETGDKPEDINALREEYQKLHPEGKKAFNGWDADKLKEKIAEFSS